MVTLAHLKEISWREKNDYYTLTKKGQCYNGRNVVIGKKDTAVCLEMAFSYPTIGPYFITEMMPVPVHSSLMCYATV